MTSARSRSEPTRGAPGSGSSKGKPAQQGLPRADRTRVQQLLPATHRPWPRRRPKASRSSSKGSGPSLPGSVITFDPDSLTARGAELEARMGEPGFWDDQQQRRGSPPSMRA